MPPQPWWHTLITLSGDLLAALGLALLFWSLFADRARTRRRCPRCWYDMTGAPLTCPECGHTARSARALLKTRRRWRWAWFALLVILPGAWLTACIPAIRADGWWAAAPRPVLITLLPYIEHNGPRDWSKPPSGLARQIDKRLFRGQWTLAPLWWPEQGLMTLIAVSTLGSDRPDFTKMTAARGLVLLWDGAVEMVAPRGRGHVVLAKSLLTYARAESYRDRGMVKGSIGIRDETPFITAYDRAQRRFRFEFLSGHPHERKLSMRYVIWTKGDNIQSWWTGNPIPRTFPRLDDALAPATGVSSGAAFAIPSMLLTDVFFARYQFASGVTYAGLPDIDGRPCHRVDTSGSGEPESVWIDAETYLVRRIEDRGQFPQVTIYDPEINIPLDDALFEFDPNHPERSPLQDDRP